MSDGIRVPEARTRPLYLLAQHTIGPAFFRACGGWHVFGREHVPADGPALLCSNHVSYLDPPAVGIAAPRRCCFMAKDALFRIPVLGPIISRLYAYPVDLDEGGRKAIRTATALLQAGELVVIFPEGRRSPEGELIRGQPGAMLIAARTQAPIVPVAVWGTDVVMPRDTRRLYRCPVYVRFGEPMAPPAVPDGERLTKEQLQAATDELMARIASLLEEIKAQVPDRWLQRAERLKARWRALRAAKEVVASESPQ